MKKRKVRRTVETKEHHKERRVQARNRAEKQEKYAGLTFFDPAAPRPVVPRRESTPAPMYPLRTDVPEDVRESFAPIDQVVERGPEPTAVTLDAEGRCSKCHVIVNVKERLNHMWWCPWWDGPEGKAASAPF